MAVGCALLFAVGSAEPAWARQPASIGRLPLLAPMPTSHVACRPLQITPELGRMGVAALMSVTDSGSGRSVTVGTGAGFELRTLMVMMGTTAGSRRESEMVNVSFTPEGRVSIGSRSASTGGVAAHLADDRRAGLFPVDSAQALSLARAVLRRCRS